MTSASITTTSNPAPKRRIITCAYVKAQRSCLCRSRFQNNHRRMPIRKVRNTTTFNRSAIRAVSRDRKSTRLNSSHTVISYAVFCLKKKKQHKENRQDKRKGDEGHRRELS